MLYKRAVYCSNGWITLTEKNNGWYCGRPICDFEWFAFDLADIASDSDLATVQAGAATVSPCYLWQLFGPPLTTVQYVVYFRFVDDVIFHIMEQIQIQIWSLRRSKLFTVTHQLHR